MTISMDDLMDAIVANDSPSKVSDAIKDLLYAKTAAQVDNLKPEVAIVFLEIKFLKTKLK